MWNFLAGETNTSLARLADKMLLLQIKGAYAELLQDNAEGSLCLYSSHSVFSDSVDTEVV